MWDPPGGLDNESLFKTEMLGVFSESEPVTDERMSVVDRLHGSVLDMSSPLRPIGGFLKAYCPVSLKFYNIFQFAMLSHVKKQITLGL